MYLYLHMSSLAQQVPNRHIYTQVWLSKGLIFMCTYSWCVHMKEGIEVELELPGD